MFDRWKRLVERAALQSEFGERIRRASVLHRSRDLVDRYIVSEARQIPRARQERALKETVDFIEKELPLTPSVDSPFTLLRLGIESSANIPGMLLEFGVWEGMTANWIARCSGRTLYGFDSFEGLPEKWTSSMDRGTFKVARLPKVRPNVTLVKGLFDQTLPTFLAEHPEPVAFVHVDSDLYSSAVTIFRCLGDRLQPGSVIVFDEFFNYPHWQDGEYRAFMEFVASRSVKFEYLSYCHFGEQLAVRLT